MIEAEKSICIESIAVSLRRFRLFSGQGDSTFFVDGMELGFEITIAKILFATFDDKGRVYRVARHAEDQRLGLRRRQLFFHAPSSPC